MYTVYIHKNITNGKRYVGITSNLPKIRWKKGFGYSDKLPIGRAFRKYGWDGFTHEIVASDLSESEAKDLEIRLIAELKTQDSMFGYNICDGGEGVSGWHPTEETKRKIGEANKGRYGSANGNYGHKWTEEMRETASRNKKGKASPETRRKISEAAKMRSGDKNPFYGRCHSDATKELLSKLRSRSVNMYDLNMKLLHTYPSIKTASECKGINKVAISNCCRGKTKTSGGYIWQYAN